MPTIIVQANHSDADAARVTLSERVLATHLQDDHYAAQLVQRLTWAVSDAERLELPADRETADEHAGLRLAPRRRVTASSGPLARPLLGTRRGGI